MRIVRSILRFISQVGACMCERGIKYGNSMAILLYQSVLFCSDVSLKIWIVEGLLSLNALIINNGYKCFPLIHTVPCKGVHLQRCQGLFSISLRSPHACLSVCNHTACINNIVPLNILTTSYCAPLQPDNFLFQSIDPESPLKATDFGLSIRHWPDVGSFVLSYILFSRF